MFGKKKTIPNGDGALTSRIGEIAMRLSPVVRDPEDIPRPFFTRNRTPREPTYKPGMLFLETGAQVQVVVKNINSGGARVDFFRHTVLTEYVFLSAASLMKAR